MQFFDRTRETSPTILQSKVADEYRREIRDLLLAEERKRSQTSVPSFNRFLEDPSLSEALNRLFHEKCAFCESRGETVAYRFRPPAEAHPRESNDRAHLYYCWLAYAWQNLYPICRGCKPSWGEDFPVAGGRVNLPSRFELDEYVRSNTGNWINYPLKESALLLDPCEMTRFAVSFEPESGGRLIGKNRKAQVTIDHFNLNRASLIEARGQQYGQLLRAISLFLAKFSPNTYPQGPPNMDFQDLEFGGTWFLLLKRLGKEIASLSGTNPTLSMGTISPFYSGLQRNPRALELFETALRKLELEDRNRPDGEVRIVSPRIKARSSQAQLQRVKISNFKSLENLEIEVQGRDDGFSPVQDAAPGLLILGENAAGKSTVLEAIASALIETPSWKNLKLDQKSFILNPIYLGSSAERPKQATVELDFGKAGSRTLVLTEGGHQYKSSNDLVLPPVFAYGAFRHFLAKKFNTSASTHVKNLFQPDFVLSNPEHWLRELDQSQFDMVVRAIRDIISLEAEFDVITRENGQCYLIFSNSGDNSATGEIKTPLALISSGFRSVLAMVCDIIQGLMNPKIHSDFSSLVSARAIVLIDEVEAHLHPRWKLQIMRGLRRALPNVTFIASTHDPLCLRGMADDEILVLRKMNVKSTSVKSNFPMVIEAVVDFPKVSELTVEQLLTSDLFEMFSTDDPETELKLARLGDALAKKQTQNGASLAPDEEEVIEEFNDEVNDTLPIGNSEVQRLVQEAVGEYIIQKRQTHAAQLKDLRSSTKARIREALQNF